MYTYKIKDPVTQQTGIDFLFDNPLSCFHAFFQNSTIFKKELWNLMLNSKSKKYDEKLEKNIKSFLRQIYYSNRDIEKVYLLCSEQLKDNVKIVCDLLNYLSNLEETNPSLFNKILSVD